MIKKENENRRTRTQVGYQRITKKKQQHDKRADNIQMGVAVTAK